MVSIGVYVGFSNILDFNVSSTPVSGVALLVLVSCCLPPTQSLLPCLLLGVNGEERRVRLSQMVSVLCPMYPQIRDLEPCSSHGRNWYYGDVVNFQISNDVSSLIIIIF